MARIPAGASYTSDTFSVNVPSSSPNDIAVRLEVDKLRYHSGQADEVVITGRGTEKVVSLLDTAYLGEVTDVAPISSFGDLGTVGSAIAGGLQAQGGSHHCRTIHVDVLLRQPVHPAKQF